MPTICGSPAWDDEAARAALVDALVADAHRLLGHLPELERDSKQAESLALLALIAGQDVESIDDDSSPAGGSWRIARRVAEDRIVSVVDPDARHAHKTVARRQDGFKAHLAVEPDTGIVTGCQLTQASGAGSGDAVAGIDLIAADATIAPAAERHKPIEVLGDSARRSGRYRQRRRRSPGRWPWSTRIRLRRRRRRDSGGTGSSWCSRRRRAQHDRRRDEGERRPNAIGSDDHGSTPTTLASGAAKTRTVSASSTTPIRP